MGEGNSIRRWNSPDWSRRERISGYLKAHQIGKEPTTRRVWAGVSGVGFLTDGVSDQNNSDWARKRLFHFTVFYLAIIFQGKMLGHIKVFHEKKHDMEYFMYCMKPLFRASMGPLAKWQRLIFMISQDTSKLFGHKNNCHMHFLRSATNLQIEGAKQSLSTMIISDYNYMFR